MSQDKSKVSDAVENDQENRGQEGRRKLLRNLAAGGGVAALGATTPDVWVKPAVESVLLPAHAATSVVQNFAGAVASAFADNSGSVLDFFVAPAHANSCNGTPLAGANAPVCIQETLSGVQITFEGGFGTGSEAQLAGAGIAVAANGLAYIFSGSKTSGNISVSCPGGGGSKGSKGGGQIFSSTYVTVEGQACA